jgi:hypothetical protein
MQHSDIPCQHVKTLSADGSMKVSDYSIIMVCTRVMSVSLKTAPAVCRFNLDEDIMTAVQWSQQQPRSPLHQKPKVTGLSPSRDGTSVFIFIHYPGYLAFMANGVCQLYESAG